MRDFAFPAMLGLAFMLGSILVAPSDNEAVDAQPHTLDEQPADARLEQMQLLEPIDFNSIEDGLVQATFVLDEDVGPTCDPVPQRPGISPVHAVSACE